MGKISSSDMRNPDMRKNSPLLCKFFGKRKKQKLSDGSDLADGSDGEKREERKKIEVKKLRG